MAKRKKVRQSLEQILASCSDVLFPEELGEAPVSINSHDVDGDTPLHVLLWRNDSYGALLLIEAGADVNAVGDMSETPLHIAVRRSDLRVVEALLAAGAKTGVISEFDLSPYDMAVERGGEILKLFQKP